ncbi:alginate lyase family protein [Roseibium sediminis]|uniref:alginate lyase family protein n=1 Tax=Roseibium sediminis TaxID=1775174 RepID=UPI00123D7CAE|nr:alginate lyase family protein [Roseibium sediminis]
MYRICLALFALSISIPTSSFADVVCVQAQLTRLGLEPGPVDGLLGAKTKLAAAAFAQKSEMDVPPLSKVNSTLWCNELTAYLTAHGAWTLNRIDLKTPPRHTLSEAQTKDLWKAYKSARQCFNHPVFGKRPNFAVKIPTNKAAQFGMWQSPFTDIRGNSACNGQRPDFNFPPKPIPVVKLDEAYGNRHVQVDVATQWFQRASTFVRLSRDPVATRLLKNSLLEWAKANSLGRGIRVNWGNRPVDYQMMTAISALVSATAEVAPSLTPKERSLIGPWLGKLVSQAAQSHWKDRQDNKAYLRTYIGLLWALMTGDRKAVDEAVEVYKLAVHDMRPDGSFPIDSQRSGMGLHYGSFSTASLVMAAAALQQATGEDLFSYQVDGRSGHDAVNFIVQGIKFPAETNKIYAIGCKEGGDRFGSPGDPSLHFIKDNLDSYLLVYAQMYPDREVSEWILANKRRGLHTAIMFDNVGGAPACQYAQTSDPNFKTEPVVVEIRGPIVLPKPKYKVDAREDLAHSKGTSPRVNSLFYASIRERGRTRSMSFNIRGSYLANSQDMALLEFVINMDNAREPKGLEKCGRGIRIDRYNSKQFGIVVPLRQENGTWEMPGNDCLGAKLPKKEASTVRFLAANFRDLAIGMVQSGSVGAIKNDGLKEWINNVAHGKVKIAIN